MFFPCSRKTLLATARRRPAAFRPMVNLLEDRSVPSAGALDPSFGSGGVVTTSFSTTDDQAYAVALQADGRLVAAGITMSTGGGAFAVARYNADGSADASFGTGGKVVTDIKSKYDQATAVAVDYSGTAATNANYRKIYVAGYTYLDTGISYPLKDGAFALVRYNANGTLDTAFGGSKAKGKVVTNFTSSGDFANDVAVQPDGKVVVTGISSGKFCLVRYNVNGSLDGTFGNQGVMTTAAPVVLDAATGDLVLQAGGKIVVVGRGSDSAGTDVSILARYNSNGSLDTAFGASGFVSLPGQIYRSLALHPDGTLVAGGSGYRNSSLYWAFARLDADGTLDASFGAAGVVVTDILGAARGVAVDAGGRIVAAGSAPGSVTSSDGYTYSDTTVVRLNANGIPDAAFGTDGKTQVAVGSYSDSAYDVVIQTDGKIVAAGYVVTKTTTPQNSDFAVTRFLGDSALVAASLPKRGSSATITSADVQPLLAEALRRWQAAGADISALRGIEVRVADLGGRTLGTASGRTITLDDNAAGWGWFVDRSPRDDAEFRGKGDPAAKGRMDLLTALTHEVGHLLGRDHDAKGVMAESLLAGVRDLPDGLSPRWAVRLHR